MSYGPITIVVSGASPALDGTYEVPYVEEDGYWWKTDEWGHIGYQPDTTVEEIAHSAILEMLQTGHSWWDYFYRVNYGNPWSTYFANINPVGGCATIVMHPPKATNPTPVNTSEQSDIVDELTWEL